MARPKKNVDVIEKDILNEMGQGAYQETALEGTVSTLDSPEGIEKANEFNDSPEYTLQVNFDNSMSVDPTMLPKKDPNCEYRFLRDEPKNLAKKTSALIFHMGGWQIVPKEHAVKKCGIDEKMLAPDGSYRAGELVLAFMPKKYYLMKKADEQRKTNARMDSVNRLLQEGSPETGAPHGSMLGIQAGKMDGGRVVFGEKNKGITKGPLGTA